MTNEATEARRAHKSAQKTAQKSAHKSAQETARKTAQKSARKTAENVTRKRPAKKAADTAEAAQAVPAEASTNAKAPKKAAKKAPAKKAAKKAPAAKVTPTETAATETAATKTAAKKAPAKKGTAKKAAKKAPASGSAGARPPKKNAAALPLPPTPEGSEDWTPAELQEVRAALLEQVAELRREYDEALAGLEVLQRQAADGAGDDQADAGTKTFEREQEMSIANNKLALLSQDERAIDRIDAGTYGRCTNCGQPIVKARLQAFPSATLCVSCKQREERR